MLSIDNNTNVTQIHSVLRIFDNRNPGGYRSYNANLPHHELVYMRSGRTIMTLNGIDHAVEPSSVFYLPLMDHHDYHVVTLEKGECIDIFFHLNLPLANYPVFIPGPHRQDLADLFSRCDEDWLSGGKTRELKVKSSLLAILAILSDEAETHVLTKKAQDAFDFGFQYLTHHCFTSQINYKEVADLCGISYSYFKRLFIERMGMAPTVFVLHKRLERAKDLLIATTDSISDIAAASGFGSTYYFSRIFHREMGISPSAYRASMM